VTIQPRRGVMASKWRYTSYGVRDFPEKIKRRMVYRMVLWQCGQVTCGWLFQLRPFRIFQIVSLDTLNRLAICPMFSPG